GCSHSKVGSEADVGVSWKQQRYKCWHVAKKILDPEIGGPSPGRRRMIGSDSVSKDSKRIHNRRADEPGMPESQRLREIIVSNTGRQRITADLPGNFRVNPRAQVAAEQQLL